jgi:hypothetical protein
MIIKLRYIGHLKIWKQFVNETVALLIEKGASVNAVTTDNQTPLHWASRWEIWEFGNSRNVTNRERSIC